MALTCIAFVRELLGTGKVFAASDGTGGIALLPGRIQPATFFLLPAGAFLTLGFILAGVRKIGDVAEKRKHKKEVLAHIGEAFRVGDEEEPANDEADPEAVGTGAESEVTDNG